MAVNLSYSALSMYEQCPKMYEFRYIEKLPSRQNGAMSYGTSIHNTLYKFLIPLLPKDTSQTSLFDEQIIPDMSLSRLLELLDENWSEFGYNDRKFMFTKKREAMELLTKWHEKYNGNFGNPILLETKFTVSCGEYTITGRFDRIDLLPDGSVHIIDYKTGKLRTQKDVDEDSQLSMYALAVKQTLGLPVGRLSLYFVTQDQEIITMRSEDSLTDFARGVEKIGTSIDQKYFPATPSKVQCTYCDFASVCSDRWIE
ncbi:MAG: RecB family exonuclease [Candidatus Gracilibacteria bacterium]